MLLVFIYPTLGNHFEVTVFTMTINRRSSRLLPHLTGSEAGWRLVFVAVVPPRFGGRAHTFRHPSLSWTRSRRAVDRGPLFSPSPSAASSAASGSPLSCDVPPPNTAPFSRNLKSQSSRLNQGPCSHSSLLKRQGWSSLCATDQEQDSHSHCPHTGDIWISS